MSDPLRNRLSELFKKGLSFLQSRLSLAWASASLFAGTGISLCAAFVKKSFLGGPRWLRNNPRWLYALGLIMLGIWVADWLEKKYAFLDLRYRSYQITQDFAARIKGELYDHNTVLVLIGDDEYWKGPYVGRAPIKKESLAELVLALDKYHPKVIALDFNFSSPIPDGSLVVYGQYAGETQTFAKAIREVSARRKVILPKTLGFDGSWITESDVYDGQDVGNARFGYIALPRDYRTVPVSVQLKSGERLDSFAEAIVRAYDLTGKGLQSDRQDGHKTYAAGYLYEDQFESFYANEVLCPDEQLSTKLLDKLSGKIVIIGGVWSRFAHSRGQRVDVRYTPVGSVPAVYLHANWVESMLESRVATPLGEIPRWILEVVLGFAAYYVFSSKVWWIWKLLYLPLLILVWLGVAYVSLQNLGLFFDPFAPTLVSLGKVGFEQINEWRKDAKSFTKQITNTKQTTNQVVAG
jgi:CHASE2 domain-containing sensor protein